jgi:capsular polysaccharide export protein
MVGPPRRRFLFLQGMATSFFARLGEGLALAGYGVRRINFCGGDRLFWSLPGAVDYRGSLKDWPRFLARRLEEWDPTDIILFGDCRPLHREALDVATGRGIAVHVVEEGYLRPNWVTFEAGGVNGHSSLSRDIDWYIEAARTTPPWTGGSPVASSFVRRATQDVLYNLASLAMSPLYWGYRSHRPWHPLLEYAGWLPRLAGQAVGRGQLATTRRRVLAEPGDCFLFPLQLDDDFQIRNHSDTGGMLPAIERVIASFGRSAPAGSRLVIKEHPLDNGLVNWRRHVRRIAAAQGVASRVDYVNGGSIEPLIDRAKALVTVNSTSGFLALSFGRPVIALGSAVYALPGLTYQGPLDRFWTDATPADPIAVDAFRRVVAARTQVNGGFFSREALGMAVAGVMERLGAPLAGEPAEPAREAAGRHGLRAGSVA